MRSMTSCLKLNVQLLTRLLQILFQTLQADTFPPQAINFSKKNKRNSFYPQFKPISQFHLDLLLQSTVEQDIKAKSLSKQLRKTIKYSCNRIPIMELVSVLFYFSQPVLACRTNWRELWPGEGGGGERGGIHNHMHVKNISIPHNFFQSTVKSHSTLSSN